MINRWCCVEPLYQYLVAGAGNADELKILEEMRAKIAEMDPESKVCFTVLYI